MGRDVSKKPVKKTGKAKKGVTKLLENAIPDVRAPDYIKETDVGQALNAKFTPFMNHLLDELPKCFKTYIGRGKRILSKDQSDTYNNI